MKLIWFIAIGIFLAPAALHPELLVIKKENGHFAPLTEADLPDSQKIMDIILKYEWPMCIASDLTPAEQDALLTPNKPFAEERFIQNKIQESVGKQYEVIFIPTAIYELFGIFLGEPFKTVHRRIAQGKGIIASANPLEIAREKYRIAFAGRSTDTIDPRKILQSLNPAAVRAQVFNLYKEVNAIFFNTEQSAAFYTNAVLGMFLFDRYPELAESRSALELFTIIKSRAGDITTRLRKIIITFYEQQIAAQAQSVDFIVKMFKNSLQNEPQTNIISKVIHLEYEARELNKGLLLRGTSFEALQVGFGQQPKEMLLAGSTLQNKKALEKEYAKKTLTPYSISFGNSLFAGSQGDHTASAYHYLTSAKPRSAAGYALLIDKKAYVEHQNNNLFFIAPLAPLAALFEIGEFFHSRTKAAVTSKNDKLMTIIGIQDKLKDPTGVFVLTRDPLRHAELFSKFLAENGRIIQGGDSTDLTDEEKNFEKQIMQSQQEAAQFYKATRTMKSAVDRAAEKFRQRKAEENMMQQE